MAELTDIRESVRERYAAAANAAMEAQDATSEAGCCGSEGVSCSPADATGVFGLALYEDTEGAPDSAVSASLGCGVPTAVADLHEGETVLDLGSGAGADVLISARRVGPIGKAIGLDMTDEMLDLARANAAEAGVKNVEFVKGYLEVSARRRERRRCDLQLRDQPLRRQAQGPRRGCAGAAPRWPVRGLRRDRRR